MKHEPRARRLAAITLALMLLFTAQAISRAEEEEDEEQGFFGTLWGIVKYVPETIYEGGKTAVNWYWDMATGVNRTDTPAPAPAPTPQPTPPPNVRTVDPVMPGEWTPDSLPPLDADYYGAWGTSNFIMEED